MNIYFTISCFAQHRMDFDPNFHFGDPLPDFKKMLEVSVDCQGHDSERFTSNDEMQDTGYSRNFITVKTARYSIVVDEDEVTGRGFLRESLDFRTTNSSPIIVITRATYGDALDEKDMSKSADVTAEVQSKVIGGKLIIEKDVDLNKLFLCDPR